MRKSSITYRFFCAFTALTLLLSISVPAGLHASGLIDLCDSNINTAGHNASPMSEAGHCNLIAGHHETDHNNISIDTYPGTDDCPLGFTCSCSVDEATAKASVVPSLSKMFAGYIPVLIRTLNATPDPEYLKPSEQVFASLYSPSLFLKNSSFLN